MVKYDFAMVFLTPRAVASYTHIFLWDGDVELTKEFDPVRYLALVKFAGLAVSQPAYSSISKSTYDFNTYSPWFPATCPRDDRLVLVDFVEVSRFARTEPERNPTQPVYLAPQHLYRITLHCHYCDALHCHYCDA